MSSACFPCIEQPVRVSLRSSKGGGWYLSSYKNGRVVTSKNRKDREEFILVPITTGKVEDNGVGVTIQSHALGGFLVVDKDTKEGESRRIVSMTKDDTVLEETKQWSLIKSSDSGSVRLTSCDSGSLACNEKGDIFLQRSDSATTDGTEEWIIESVTGELCFLSSPLVDQRLRCDMMGQLSMTDNWKGWEVWRFIESSSSKGHVKITSWMHSQHFLCSDAQGGVRTCSLNQSIAEADTLCTNWAVEKAPKGLGVTIRSADYGRLLTVKDLGESLCLYTVGDEAGVASDGDLQASDEKDGSKTDATSTTTSLTPQTSDAQTASKNATNDDESPKKENASVWHLEAAHLQTYSISTHNSGAEAAKSIGPFPYLTPNLKQSDDWKIEHASGNCVSLYSPQKEQYMGSNSNGEVFLSDDAKEPELWIMEISPDGYMFKSSHHNLYLSYTGTDAVNGILCTKTLNAVDNKERVGVVWRLDPCMPRAVSSSKIKTFAIGTTAAIATTVAMPFAMAGVMGILGAVGAEVGVLANIVTIGLTGAEAIASVGVVGATAAIVFRESGDSLTLNNDSKDDDDASPANSYSKRPLCSWRAW